jgi:16S rRNA G1207 methylase RsmC
MQEQLQDEFLARLAEKNANRLTQQLTVAGLDRALIVYRSVFSPDPDMMSAFSLMTHVPDLAGRRVLDLGTGTGVLAILAAKRGAAQVVAVDLDPVAVSNARENVFRNGLDNVSVLQGDLFEPAEGRFDLILANLPIYAPLYAHMGISLKDIYVRFFRQLPAFLTERGKVLFQFTSYGDRACLAEMSSFGLRWATHCVERFGVDWYVYESISA